MDITEPANNQRTDTKRLTIGLITTGSLMQVEEDHWMGVVNEAKAQGVNVICLPGTLLYSEHDGTEQFNPLRNTLFDLIDPNRFDGLLIWTGALNWHITPQATAAFFDRYRPMPIVSVEVPLIGYPSVLVDDYGGMKQAVSHLIEVHGYRKIGVLCGPSKHIGAQERYRGYQDALQEHGLELNPALVSPEDSSWIGIEPIKALIEERGLRPGKDIDAIASVNSNMAKGAVDWLNARGIKTPGEIAFVGFDYNDARYTIPLMTVVDAQFYEVGRLAVQTLIGQIRGEQPPERIIVPSHLVVNQSCGCISHEVQQATVVAKRSQASDKPNSLVKQKSTLLTTLTDAGYTPSEINPVVEAFFQELTEQPAGQFLQSLQEALYTAARGTHEPVNQVNAWQGVIAAMRGGLMPTLGSARLAVASNLWQQAQILLNEVTLLVRERTQLQIETQTQNLRTLSQTLITTFDIASLMDVLAMELPHLGMPSAYLALYEDEKNIMEQARLQLAYTAEGRINLGSEGRSYPTRSLVPENILPQDHPFSYVAEPLYFHQKNIGIALFEVAGQNSAVFESLGKEISSALQGALLVQQVERRAVQLQTAADVSRAASSILESDALFQSVVNLIQERFSLNYAGLFLIDQTGSEANQSGRWAVLRAATGEAGRQMIANGYKLQIGGESMISWCITNQQARIALDVGRDAVRFNNPLLPETHSEIAIPLITRDKVVGALTIQSARSSAFTQDDLTVLQTMADQLANAIENARLFEQTQQRTVELSKAREIAEAARREAEAEKEAAEAAKEEAEKARRGIEAANRTLAAQMWQTTGQTQLNDRMRGEQDIATLANNVIKQLCSYLDVQVGALYVLETDVLKLAGTYAYRRKNLTDEFQIGEGLVGEAALEKRMIFITLPDHYVTGIFSTTGELLPQHILVAPFAYEGQVIGVVEIEALTEFTAAQLEFLNKALESIAVGFTTAQARRRVNELLAKTQQQAGELQTQEEELRSANEELASQAENLRASEAKLRANQVELESVNVELEEKAAVLQEQRQVLDRQNRELRVAQQELQQKAEDLAIASKYKSEFLANMSHELRTPLNSLLILSGMLAKNEQGNLTPDQVESAQIICSGGTDLLNLINDILDLSKVEAGRMEFRYAALPLARLIESMRAQFMPLAEGKGIEFVIQQADNLPETIESDQQRVDQIIKNLLSNAFKFTSQGSVRLQLSRPAIGTDLSKSGLKIEQAIAIIVADTGIGMTPEQQKIVFEAFQQADGSTSRQYGGTGLGLSISRELATKLGGQIDLESEAGKGSRFTLYLPLARQEPPVDSRQTLAAPTPADLPRHNQTQPLASAAQTILQTSDASLAPVVLDDRAILRAGDRVLLIIEDDLLFAEIVQDYGRRKNFKCLIASDGESGLKLAQRHKPEAIILDLNLPDISGWEVLDELKHNPDTMHIPVHIITGQDESLEAFKRGAMGFLTKPIGTPELEGAFQNLEQVMARKIKSLLVVEDDDNLRKSVRKLLEGSDVTISEANTGQAALALLGVQHFDCMVLDLTLPDMSGFELLNRLDGAEYLPKCPVIVYTGKALSEDENQELMKYADSVIVKGAKSPERLLDETALFLHRVVADMPEEKQRMIKRLLGNEGVLAGKQILIVDDDARNAFALSKFLGDKGLMVYIAPNGEKALDILGKTAIDLVLMDIMLPGMDGYEITRRIRAQQRFRRLPILALTAKAMKGDREKCLEAGANDYLSKPVDVERLLSMLRVWLSQE